MAQEDAGIKAAERQRKTRKYKSIESWTPGASGQSQLINGATGGQAVCRDPVAGCISRGHPPVVRSGQSGVVSSVCALKAVYRALNMAKDREEPHGTVRKQCRPGKSSGVQVLDEQARAARYMNFKICLSF
ncbi:hypothetical protein T08_15906 [Trichinella sp. T8]|nr:hypothetical protein T08_15906 [Trichinella sp. T8]